MAKGKQVPDAWDDDWESLADQMKEEEPPMSSSQQQEIEKTTKAERLARHMEQQRKLWEAAETPAEEPVFVAVSHNVPLATGFKPAMKLLSRKPAPKTVSRRDPVTGLEQLTLEDDEDDDPNANKPQPTPEEIRLRQQRELEEKQRRYDEARARLFGNSNPSSGQSTPGNTTPPQSDVRPNQRGRGRGRGGGGHRNETRQDNNNNRSDTAQNRRQPQQQQQQQVPSGLQASTRELFDPNYAPKPGFTVQKREYSNRSPALEEQIIRAPRGPDSSGRGGFGFARRGGGGAKEP